MKNKILSFLFLALTLPCLSFAQSFVNLTPAAKTMTTGTGKLVLPEKFAVNTAADLTQEMKVEVQHFIDTFNAATGYQAVATDAADALIQVKKNETLADEGYKIKVQTTGVTIEAKTDRGLFYAFQSIKKILPANVMAGVKDATVTEYALPIVDLDDAPRYGYRGFMLDTSRHFFSVKELKRVLDVMAYYKMNTFHWHITDDHGWRVEIKKYPRLTSVGSVSKTSYMVDMKDGEFWLNKPYGPYFYTQQDVKDVVAYAQERHITIIPEIDMPGHFSAAMAAYPEYSCDPMGFHEVITERAGVFKDILNVANPDAVQFAKDILTEIMALFPGDQIHIGGDECPTDGWQQNKQCQDMMKKLGLGSNWRGLQSHFIKEMADHVKAQGRKLCVWNEAITANGALTNLVKESGATVYCWVAGQADKAAKKAADLGLPHVYTPQPNWYIQRKQSTDPGEPVGAGNGNDNLEVVYNKSIPTTNARLFKGVQACFWSEFVAFDEYLEYLMLPRLVAVAEAGWSPQSKRVFADFQKRISADAKLFDYNHYNYGKHYMTSETQSGKVMPEVSTTTEKHWYRIVNRATDERANKCIELLSKSAADAMNQAYAGKGAQENRLWTNAQKATDDAAIDYQLWSLEESATHKGHYALVCKALPEGSVKATATGKGLGDRWDYAANEKHYNFILGDYGTTGYGKDGNTYYYSIRSDQQEGFWMNTSKAGQGYALNVWSKADDQAAGLFNFVPMSVGKVMPVVSTTTSPFWYRIETCATDANRSGRCIQLATEETAAALGGTAGQLWTNKNRLNSTDANADYQFWGFEQDPQHPDRYALVCKAQPQGSVNATPTAQTVSGRWNYDNHAKHYQFILADNGYGQEGDYYYYSIRSDQVDGLWMNAAAAGQKYAVNLYNKLNDGTKAGYWKLIPEVAPITPATVEQLVKEAQLYLTDVMTYTDPANKMPAQFGKKETSALRQLVQDVDLSAMTATQLSAFYNELSTAYTAFWTSYAYFEKGEHYLFNCSAKDFNFLGLCDDGNFSTTKEFWADDAWLVTESTINDDHTQTVKLQNAHTKRFIGAPSTTVTDRLGYVVGLSETGAPISIVYDPEHQDIVLSVEGKNLFPTLMDNKVYAGSSIANGNAVFAQGAGWLPQHVKVLAFDCVTQDNQPLGEYRRSWMFGVSGEAFPPEIKNYRYVEKNAEGKYVYERTGYAVNIVGRDQYGAIVSEREVSVRINEQVDLALPYYTFASATAQGKTVNQVFTPVKDMNIEAQYTTTALNGVKKLGQAVSAVTAGHTYVLYNATNAEGRSGYRKVNAALQVNRSMSVEKVGPSHVWTLEADGNQFKVKNAYCNLYVPELERSKIATMSKTAGVYTFTYNAGGKFWDIKGTGAYSYWNGDENGYLVGWNGAHPTHIFEYYAQPYFKVRVEYVDAEGNALEAARETWIKAGEAFTLNVPVREGYSTEILNGEQVNAVDDNLNIKVVYKHTYTVKTTGGENLGNRSISTFSAAYATTPSDPEVEAFWAEKHNGNTIVLSKINSENGPLVIPANTGVVLASPTAEKINMVQTSDTPVTVASTNLLHPTGDAGTTLDGLANAYILAKKADEQVLFHRLSDTDRTLGANRAYLLLPNETQANVIKIDFGELTGIEGIMGNADHSLIYDLSGRKVLTPTKGGIYIKNGKKYLLK